TYALAVMTPRNPDLLVGARRGSPLVLGIGEGEFFLASDPGALAGLTDRVVFLQDRQVAVISTMGWQVLDAERGSVSVRVQMIDPVPAEADRAEHAHYMLKEIYEQPEALEHAMHGRLCESDASACFDKLNIDPQQL